MRKFSVIFVLFCVFFLVSCGDDSIKVSTNDSTDSGDSSDSTSDNGDSADSASDSNDTDNSGNGGASKEGVYLGIIGFNEELFQENKYAKEIGLLNSSTESDYTSFINNLYASKGTALYYADYKALEMMSKSSITSKLQKVALVTFTDGLDNLSTDEYDPENYDDPDVYLNAIHDKIVKEKIHGKSVEAFSIGLKGREEGVEPEQFEGTLKKLASSDSKAFLVSDMDEVMEHFDTIAKSLYSATTTVNLAVLLPGGYKDGELLRFTFDNPESAADSELYIEATFRKTDNGRNLEKISYHGFAKGEATIPQKEKEGAYYRFVFEDLKYDKGNAPSWSESELRNILKLWKQNSSGGWYTDSEFDPASSSKLEEERSSALIMLVLDCTTSLGSDFSRMQEIAKDFVKTLVNGSSGGNGNSNENNDGNGESNGGDDSNTGNNEDALETPSCDSGLSLAIGDYPGNAVKLAQAMGICEGLVSAEISLAGEPVTEQIDTNPNACSNGSCNYNPTARQSRAKPYYESDYQTFAVTNMFGTQMTPLEGNMLAVLSTGPWNSPTMNAQIATLAAGDMQTASKLPEDWINMMPGCEIPKAPSCGGQTPQTGLNNQCSGKEIPSVQDPIMLTLKMKVPANARAFEFSLFFMSIEYPTTVCNDKNYNDFFIALLDSTYNETNPTAEYKNPYDKNLAKDELGNPVGVDLAPAGLFRACNPNCNNTLTGNLNKWGACENDILLNGTGFGTDGAACSSGHGGTGWLRVAGNVEPNETITLRLALWEQGEVSYGPDHSYDSTVVLDGFKWLPNPTKTGIIPN